MTKLNPIHVGEHLSEFLDEFDITAYRLAKDINVPNTRIDQIVKCKRSMSADTATRLGKYFGTSADFWMNLQTKYELSSVDQSIINEIETIAA